MSITADPPAPFNMLQGPYLNSAAMAMQLPAQRVRRQPRGTVRRRSASSSVRVSCGEGDARRRGTCWLRGERAAWRPRRRWRLCRRCGRTTTTNSTSWRTRIASATCVGLRSPRCVTPALHFHPPTSFLFFCPGSCVCTMHDATECVSDRVRRHFSHTHTTRVEALGSALRPNCSSWVPCE